MKDKVVSILFVIILFVTGMFLLISNDKGISFYERRNLTTTKDIKDDFFGNLDDYMSDQFPFRDELISLNSLFNRYVLMNYEKNDVYVVDDFLIDKNYPYDYKSLDRFINKINYINDNYLDNSKVYFSVIPDKSYFLDDDKYLRLDFDSIFKKLQDNINIEYIDIVDNLNLDDYYKTDIHLKQDSYFKLLNKFNDYLDFNYRKLDYEKNVFNSFYGASTSKAGSYVNRESIDYYSNDIIDNVRVKHLEYGFNNVYDIDKLEGIDAYNLFLSGPSALIEIENDNSLTDKELIIFRDSFASSLTPLLIPYYKNITLIDLRYINMDQVLKYVNFDDKDVLFIYSTLIINNSNILKVVVK